MRNAIYRPLWMIVLTRIVVAGMSVASDTLSAFFANQPALASQALRGTGTAAKRAEIKNLAPHNSRRTCVGYAISLVENLSKFSFCLDTRRPRAETRPSRERQSRTGRHPMGGQDPQADFWPGTLPVCPSLVLDYGVYRNPGRRTARIYYLHQEFPNPGILSDNRPAKMCGLTLM
jgi:hypothetical protein